MLLLVHQIVFAQNAPSLSGRWRLKFEMVENPQNITLTEPDGKKNMYWYFRYRIINDTEQNIPWMVNIKVLIDRTREGIAEAQVPGLFYQAQIPENLDKEVYLSRLKAYYDFDLPLVKRAIYARLHLYPKLSEKERGVLNALSSEKMKSVEEIMKEVELSYVEAESILNSLVISNLAISQEAAGSPTLLRIGHQGASFLENNKEVVKPLGSIIAGWNIVALSPLQVSLQKDNVITSIGIGNTLEYLYQKTDKTFAERDLNYSSGMSTKGLYKGRSGHLLTRIDAENAIFTKNGKEITTKVGDTLSGWQIESIAADAIVMKKGEKTTNLGIGKILEYQETMPDAEVYLFEKRFIPKKSVHHGLAIFEDFSSEMDFMAVVVSGLVDPIVRRRGKVYKENEALMIGYTQGLSDEEAGQDIRQLYLKWVILSSKEIKHEE